MEDNRLIMLGVICSKCNAVLDVISNKRELLYIDKICKCGSIGFYTIEIKVKIITGNPYWQKPFSEMDGYIF